MRMKGTVTESKAFMYMGVLVNVFSGESVASPGSPSSPREIYVSTTSDLLPVLVNSESGGLNLSETFRNKEGHSTSTRPGASNIQSSRTKN